MIFSIGPNVDEQPPQQNWAEIDSALALRNIEMWMGTKPKLGSCYCGFVIRANRVNPKIVEHLGVDGKKFRISGALMVCQHSFFPNTFHFQISYTIFIKSQVGKTDIVYKTKVHRKEREFKVHKQ